MAEPGRDKGDKERERERIRDRFLSGAYVDIPAPELEWEQMPSATVPRLDGSAVQINELFYVLSGYGTLDYVSIFILILFSVNLNVDSGV